MLSVPDTGKREVFMKKKFFAATALVAASLVAAAANAGTTTVNSPWAADGSGAELNLDRALGVSVMNTFGAGSYTVTGSLDSTLTVVLDGDVLNAYSLVRVGDFGGTNPLNGDGTNVGAANDGIWSSADTTFKLTAQYTGGLEEDFGYFAGSTGGTFTKLFEVPNQSIGSTNTNPAGAVLNLSGDTTFRLGATRAFNTGDAYSSQSSENTGLDAGHPDHFVTYALLDAGGNFDSFFVGFEDLAGGDYDYNDLVVRVQTTAGAAAVPIPTAVVGGFVLMSLAGAQRIRRMIRSA